MVNYRPQKFLGLLAPTQYARVTRLSPAFRVRVWLRETTPFGGIWEVSLVPRPSCRPVFDSSQYAYCKITKTGRWEGLGTRLWELKSELKLCWSCTSAQDGEHTTKATKHLVVLHLPVHWTTSSSGSLMSVLLQH